MFNSLVTRDVEYDIITGHHTSVHYCSYGIFVNQWPFIFSTHLFYISNDIFKCGVIWNCDSDIDIDIYST